jgi:hypothetical protein
LGHCWLMPTGRALPTTFGSPRSRALPRKIALIE